MHIRLIGLVQIGFGVVCGASASGEVLSLPSGFKAALKLSMQRFIGAVARCFLLVVRILLIF